MKKASRRVLAALLATSLMAGGVNSVSAQPVGDVAIDGCSFGADGFQAASLCWIDFAGVTPGERAEIELGDYTLSFTPVFDSARIESREFPTWPGAYLGNSVYTGVVGRPALYQAVNGSEDEVTLNDITLTRGGVPVSGFSFILADAETTDAGEYLEFGATNADGTATNRTTREAGGGEFRQDYTGVDGVLTQFSVDPSSATLMKVEDPESVSITVKGNGLQGAAFGVLLSTVQGDLDIRGMNGTSADDFQLEAFQGNPDARGESLTTATRNELGTTATSQVPVISRENQQVTFELTPTAGNTADFANYYKQWRCTVDGLAVSEDQMTVSNTENASSVTVNIAPGQSVDCAVEVFFLEYDEQETPVGDEVASPLQEDAPEGSTFQVSSEWEIPENWDVTVDPFTGEVTATPQDGVEHGAFIEVPVTVTYPDASTGRLTAKITPTLNDAERFTPEYPAHSTPAGTPVDSPVTTPEDFPEDSTFGLPEDYTPPTGWEVTIDPGTGVITTTPPAGLETDTTIDVPVIVNYPDGSEGQTTATITGTPNAAGIFDPSYDPQFTPAGESVGSEISEDLPEGTTFGLPEDYTPPTGWEVTIDPETGVITTTPPAGLDISTTIDVPVTVTYPDTTTSQLIATITGLPRDISYDDSFTHPGVAVEVNQTGAFGVPAGTVFEAGDVVNENGDPVEGWDVEIDEYTGRLTITPPADADPDEKYWVNVTATTPSGVEYETTAGVQVAQEIQQVEIRDDGHLWLLVNGEWIDLGQVVGEDGVQGEPGAPGADLTIVSSTINEDGSVTIEFSDGNSVTIPAGQPGTPGADGEDGEDLTIVSSTINEDGTVTIEFSDGTTVTIPAGQPGAPGEDGEDLTIVNQYIDEDGNTVVEFSNGQVVTIPAGQPGAPGADGEDGEDLTIVSSTINEDGSVTIVFSDGNSVTIPAGQPGTPGADGRPGADGEDGAPGEALTIVKQYINEDGNTVIEFSNGQIVTVQGGKDGEDGKDGVGSSLDLFPGGSSTGANGATGSSNERCVQAVGTVVLPLLLVAPLALAAQVNIPGLSPLISQAEAQLQEINNSLTQGSGAYNSDAAGIANQINAELAKAGLDAGQLAGAAGLLVVGSVAAKYLYDNCA